MRARIQNADHDDKVGIRLQDYRDERDQYDWIASIAMIEAVGEQFWHSCHPRTHFWARLCQDARNLAK